MTSGYRPLSDRDPTDAPPEIEAPDTQIMSPRENEPEDDSDFDIDDYDEEEGEGEGDTGPTAFWVDELTQLNNSAIDEAMLHIVPWGDVAKELALNMSASLAVLGFHLLAQSSLLIESVTFTVSVLLVVIGYELCDEEGVVYKGLYGCMILVTSVAGTIYLHPSGIMAILTTVPRVLLAAAVGCSLIVVMIGACFQKLNYSSACVNAITGLKIMNVSRRFDVVKLLKAMKVVPGEELEHQAGLFGKLQSMFCSCCNKDVSAIVIGMIQVDDARPDVTLELNGEQLRDSEYRLVRLRVDAVDPPTDIDFLKIMHTILKRKGTATDQILKQWMDPNEEPKGLDKLSDFGKKIKTWFWKNKLHAEPFEMTVTAQHINRLEAIQDHWATRSLIVALLTNFCSLPARFFYHHMTELQGELCSGDAPIHLPGGELLCGHAEACDHICSNPLHYVEAVNNLLHTSHVESLFVFILLPVYIFLFSVMRVQHEHIRFERQYLKGLNRSKAAVQEVLRFKLAFESMLTVGQVFGRFRDRFIAWNPLMSGDPDLTARRSFIREKLEDQDWENKAFKHIANTILASAFSQTMDETIWVYGCRVDPDDEDGPNEDADDLVAEWEDMVLRNNLGGEKNATVAFTVGCKSEAAWNMWKNWMFQDYKRQLEYILANPNAQDSGSGSHLEKSTVLGDQGVPKGFSMTHIVTRNPQDNSTFQIELGTDLGIDKLNKELVEMEKMLKAPKDDDEESSISPAKTLKLNQRLEQDDFEIGVRFVLTEQYYKNMPTEAKSKLLAQCGDNSTDDGNFIKFVGMMLRPHKEAAKETKDTTDEDFTDMTMSYLTLIMGEDEPIKSMIDTGKVLVRRVWVIVLCAIFVMIVPCYRKVVQGGSLFPMPFEHCLPLNAACCLVVLWSFLSQFQVISERLGLVCGALVGFEQKTIDPTGRAHKKAATKNKAKGADKETAVDDESGFDLTVMEAKGQLYDPTDEWWIGQWKAKQDNVQNWHYCAGYTRVFVSASRLSAQAVLLAAGLILAFLLVLSFAQVMDGHNGSGLTNMVNGYMDVAKKKIEDGRRLSFNLANSDIGIEMTSAHDAPSFDFRNATASLMHQVQPFQAAMLSVSGRLLSTEDLNRVQQELKADMAMIDKGLSIAKTITKTQILTVTMVLLLLCYSVPLLYYVAKINQSFEKLGNLLLSQKELHRMNMAQREKQLAAAKDARASSASVVDEPPAYEPPAAEKDTAAVEDGPQAGVKGTTVVKDMPCKRFEKMLDVAIQSANKTKSRFPLTLFGFVINMSLLTSWVALAITPIAKQGQQMAPGLAMAGCEWLSHSTFIKEVEKTEKMLLKKAHIKHAFSLHKAFDSLVCKPLRKIVKKDVSKALSNQMEERRLSADVALSPLVEKWWRVYPGDPQKKLKAVVHVLDTLEGELREHAEEFGDEFEIWDQSDSLDRFERQSAIAAGEPTSVPNPPTVGDVKTWGRAHALPDSLMVALEEEEIFTVAELAMLSDKEVEFLCESTKLGDKARFKLMVQAARKATAQQHFTEL